jgi:hypothetical protein
MNLKRENFENLDKNWEQLHKDIISLVLEVEDMFDNYLIYKLGQEETERAKYTLKGYIYPILDSAKILYLDCKEDYNNE